MATNQPKQITPRSKYFGLMLFLACLLGLPAAFGIYAWISSQATHSMRIPVLLLLIPFIIMLYAIMYIDKHILTKYPHLVGKRHRQMLAEQLGYDPLTRTPLSADRGQAPAYGAPQTPASDQAPTQTHASVYGSYGSTMS